MIFSFALFAILAISMLEANGARNDRTLYLYYTHTKETAKITFKRNGRYDSKGLKQLNHMTRDWRRNEPTKMDPALFDLLWEVYQESGATGPIHIVSAYRSPATNNMLRSKSRGVAKNSRHTHGQAIDFYIPGVRLSRLRQIAMKKQVGGVGYYPTSNSPFMHLDTGNVRAWPRMTTAQLKRLFPDGKTLHVPNTGVPISNKGYQLALADWKKCKTVPCTSRNTTRTTRVANATRNAEKSNSSSSRTLMDLFFGNEESEGQEEGNISLASRTAPTRISANVRSKPAKAPIPQTRPNFANIQLAQIPSNQTLANNAPTPLMRSKNPLAQNNISTNISNDDNIIPKPRILLSRLNDKELSQQISAYAPINIATPSAQQAVRNLIENSQENTAKSTIDPISTASLNGSLPIVTQNIIENSFGAVINAGLIKKPRLKTKEIYFNQREIFLFAPDLEHVADIFTDSKAMSSARYAIIFEPDEAYISPESELGRFSKKLTFSNDASSGLKTNKFISSMPLIIASR